jgi:polo-like kinase 4
VERKGHGLEADVWSLGCMMFTFLTGKPPFDTEGIRNTLNKVMQGEFAMPQHITAEAQDLIRCLLQKNPHDRIPLNSKHHALKLYKFYFNYILQRFSSIRS